VYPGPVRVLCFTDFQQTGPRVPRFVQGSSVRRGEFDAWYLRIAEEPVPAALCRSGRRQALCWLLVLPKGMSSIFVAYYEVVLPVAEIHSGGGPRCHGYKGHVAMSCSMGL
jgi:hypothetical protein